MEWVGTASSSKAGQETEEGGEGEKHSLLCLLWERTGTAWKAMTELYSLDDLGSFCSKEEVPGSLVSGRRVSGHVALSERANQSRLWIS